MAVREFPNPRRTSEEGIVALGGDLEPESLLLAYGQGIFPWPVEGLPLPWFCPPERGVLEFSRLHVPRSLLKAARKLKFEFTIDRAFPEVIQACAESPRPPTPGSSKETGSVGCDDPAEGDASEDASDDEAEPETWITPELLEAYLEFHEAGYAHSVEAWENGKLVGGVYGVEVRGVFSAESMFYRRPYASKLALLHLVEHLRSKGLEWMDIQVLTPHMEAMGARLISRDHFLDELARSHARGLNPFDRPKAGSLS